MASLIGRLRFWTVKTDTLVTESDISCLSYHGKGSIGSRPYDEELKRYYQENGMTWSPSNKGPEKLRETLKETEELLANYRCVSCEWRTRNCLQLMLNNGALIIVWVKPGIGDIEKIRIDKYLVGKLHSDHVVEVYFCDAAILISYVEPKLTLIQLSKKLNYLSGTPSKKTEKLSNLDPKISTMDLIGPSGRRLERRLSCSVQYDQLMIWWMSSSDEVWPWTPVSTDRERANIHIYGLNGSEVNLLCYTRTKSDPIWASYSSLHLHQIYTIEQQVSRKGDITVDMCIYEIHKSKIQRNAVTTISLGCSVVCHGMNFTEDRILLGCKDGSLVMYDMKRKKKNTHITRAAFVPSVIGWHPSGSIVMVGSEKGQIQCYDMALCCLNLELVSEDPNPVRMIDLPVYFKFQPALMKLAWNPLEFAPSDVTGHMDNTHTLLLLIDRGPLTVAVFRTGIHNKGSLTAVDLVSQYVKCQQTYEAVNLLLNMNWNVEKELCFKCLTIIMNHLLRLPMTEDIEVQMESALSSYYLAPYRLSDVITLEYDNKLVRLARRCFHHLLRYGRFEKAFLLAGDIGARDLFMDIHYVAKDKCERTLAQAALNRAKELEKDADSSSVGSQQWEDESDYKSSTSCSSYCSDNDEPVDVTGPSGDQQSPSAAQGPSTWRRQEAPQHPVEARRLYSNSAATKTQQQEAALSYAQTQRALSEKGPMASHQQGLFSRDLPAEETSEEDEDGHGTVHVVHFGVV